MKNIELDELDPFPYVSCLPCFFAYFISYTDIEELV